MEKPLFIKRKIDTKIQDYLKMPEILAIVGPRQAGKTTYLKNLCTIKNGLFISFEDIDILNLFNNDIKSFARTHVEGNDLICIDEFQYAKNGGKNLKYLYDTYKNKKIIISGSSVIDITIHAIKFLVGRVIVVNFWPFDIDELRIVFKNINDAKLYEYYSTFGGYPRVALAKDDDERKLILKNIYNTYFLREVKDILGLIDEYKIEKLLMYIAQTVGSTINYSKVANSCDIDERSVRKYIEFMNQTYVAYTCRPFFTNKLKEIVKQPKLYFYDNGFYNHVLGFDSLKGSKLEQTIVSELIKNNCDIKYWRTKAGSELDFVVYKDNKIVTAIEAKSSGMESKSYTDFNSMYKNITTQIIDQKNIFSILCQIK